MGIVVDTNVFIDIENGRYDLDGLMKFEKYGDTFIAAVTVSELIVGIHLADDEAIKIRREAFVESIISTVPVLAFTEEVARIYSQVYAIFLKPRSRLISNVHDLQIASTALLHGYPVLTSNVDDFKKILYKEPIIL